MRVDELLDPSNCTYPIYRGQGWAMLIHPSWAQVVEAEANYFNSKLFDPTTYGEQAQRVSDGGRNAAWYIQTPIGAAVLRHYQRGGLMARVSRDRYLFSGEAKVRSFQEFRVMNYLAQCGVPVPPALGAFYQRQGLGVRMALITQCVPHSQSLSRVVQAVLEGQLSQKQFAQYAQEVAAAIAQMHDAGIWHADLNAFNILCCHGTEQQACDTKQSAQALDPHAQGIDSGGDLNNVHKHRVYLIDFDKAVYREALVASPAPPAPTARLTATEKAEATAVASKASNASTAISAKGRQWRQQNLDRLARSLHKQFGEQSIVFMRQIEVFYAQHLA